MISTGLPSQGESPESKSGNLSQMPSRTPLAACPPYAKKGSFTAHRSRKSWRRAASYRPPNVGRGAVKFIKRCYLRLRLRPREPEQVKVFSAAGPRKHNGNRLK